VSYDYLVPAGMGDQFFQYVFDAVPLTNGTDYSALSLFIDNFDFICRHWSGWDTVIDPTTGSIQVYDDIHRQWFSLEAKLGSFATGAAVVPEKRYRVNSSIKFDITDATSDNAASQLVFTGVRRIPGVNSDPAPSLYKYKRVSFSYPYTLVVQQTPTAIQDIAIPVTDYDFELERVEMTPYAAVSPFSITLFDSNKIARSNLPVNANRFFHFNPTASNGELNFWPCPPIMYAVNSSIRFAINSILAIGPATYQLQFVGNRRIPCQ